MPYQSIVGEDALEQGDNAQRVRENVGREREDARREHGTTRREPREARPTASSQERSLRWAPATPRARYAGRGFAGQCLGGGRSRLLCR